MKAILIDFGSTFTKVLVVDIERRIVLKRSFTPSTVETDISIGLSKVLRSIGYDLSDLKERKFDYQLSCSSAAGGLKMIAVGLVPQLTVEAAKKAALGAGANVLSTYSHELTIDDVNKIEQQAPDIILLSGGSDGGNKQTVVHNAQMLAKSKITVPIIVACNKSASETVEKILNTQGKPTRITANVMPELWELNIDPAKEEIRKVFLDRIVNAKGLDKITQWVDVLKPTPSATMKAVELLAQGGEETEGIGDLLAIEVGGATTNVYSVAEGTSDHPKIILRGFTEPIVKRTVEGDLGLRYNAKSIVEKISKKTFETILQEEGDNWEGDISRKISFLSEHTSFLPVEEEDFIFDSALSRVAVRLAVTRHCGYLTEVRLPAGVVFIQRGKDLRKVRYVIGTGGGITYIKNQKQVLSEALFNSNESLILRPENPKLYLDQEYVLWAMGLLADIDPEAANTIIKKSLTPI